MGMLPMWKCCQCQCCQFSIGDWKLGLATLAILATFLSAHAENAYTNHAGNVVSGWPVELTATQVVLSECASTTNALGTKHQAIGTTYPLSIFPTNEQRRIAADYVFGHPEAGIAALRVPTAVKRAIAGADKAMARSRKRAEKGLCTKEESDAFCVKSEAALKSYLDKQVKDGVITPAERKALDR